MLVSKMDEALLEKRRDEIVSLRQKVFRKCFRMVSGEFGDALTLAEDLTQDVIAKALQNAHKFRGDSEISSWLFRIAHNTTLTYFRNGRRDPLRNTNPPVNISVDAFEDATINDVIDKTDNNDPRALFLRRILNQELASLSERQRRILTMRLEGYSFNEISAELNMNYSTAKGTYFKAVQKIKARYVQAA